MNNIPKHIVLFPDGNRRWAKAHALSSLQGHQKGREHFEEFLLWCKEKGVTVVTVFGFSTENWSRPQEEVAYLMDLFENYLGSENSLEQFQKEGIRVRVIGQKDKLRPSLQSIIQNVEEVTKDNTTLTMNLAVSYGGKWDIAQAANKASQQGEITQESIEANLSTTGQPTPDLVIRAGGEKRLSNFLLWQAAYAELYFSDKLWPDFDKQEFEKALGEYAVRQRRFGT